MNYHKNSYGHIDRRDPKLVFGDPDYECCENCQYRYPEVCTERGPTVLANDWCSSYQREGPLTEPWSPPDFTFGPTESFWPIWTWYWWVPLSMSQCCHSRLQDVGSMAERVLRCPMCLKEIDRYPGW